MKKLIFSLSLLFVLILLSVENVNAATYQIENVSTTLQLVPSNQYINIKWNTEYYNAVAYDSVWFFNPYVSIYENTENEYYPYLTPGQYLIEFIVYGVGDYVNFTCQNLSSNFQNINMTTGSWVSNEIESVCVDTYNGTYAGRSAAHVLYSFTYKGQDQINELRFNLSSNIGFFTGRADGLTYALSVSPIYDYDINIVNNFKSEKNESIQLNQNQTIINQNNQTNEELGNINDNITSSDVDSPNDSFSEFESYLPENGVITELITLPISLFQRVLSSINGTCSSYNLGNLFGTDLTLPCINISTYIGTNLWNVIDVLFSGFFVLVIGKKMIKAFNNFSSMEEGDVLD